MRPFEDIVAEEGPVVWRVCRALLPEADAEDAWAEAFLAALRAYPRLRPDSNVRGWLVTIAHRKAIDQLRDTARRPRPAGPPQGGDLEQPGAGRASVALAADIEAADVTAAWALRGAGPVDHDDLLAALRALAPKQQACVVFRHLADLPYDEVAARLGISEAAARRNTADGLARLRRDPALRALGGARTPAPPDEQRSRR